MKQKHFILALVAMLSSFSFTANAQVAKVGSTAYTTIDEAIAAWTNGTTLTLLDNVTLSDVVTLNSTEHHILDLGTYTMTAASGKNAFVIKACGTGSAERSAITINADATNPGGINAGNKCVVYYKYADGGISTDDRPIIKINGGVFTGSTSYLGTAGIYTIGTAARKCATVNITGGTFNCSILGSSKSKLIVSGGVFNYTVSSQGDSTCSRLISGGTFKTLGFMTADSNNTKFWIGTSMGNSNVGVHIDDNGYIVVGGPVITEAGETFEASANYSGASSYLQYSSAATNGLYYTSVEEALADNNKTSGSVTVYVDELDMTGISYKGTIVIPAGNDITITNVPDDATVLLTNEDGTTTELTPNSNGTITTIVPKGNNFNGYTGTDAIWGEVWGNASESFVIKVLDKDGNVMGTTSLNNIGGIIDGDVTVTWNLKLDAASNTDEYWTMEWATAPSINNMPAKVALWVDGTEVSGGDVVLNGPDDLNKIVAAVTDAEGKILGYYTTLANAVATNATNIALLRNTDEEVELPLGVTLNKNGFTADNVTETLPVVKIGEDGYTSFAQAIEAAKAANLADVEITIVGENTPETADDFGLYEKTAFNNVTIKQDNGNKPYYVDCIHTGKRAISDGQFVFDGVNIVITGQYITQCKTVLKNNSVVKRTDDTKNFIYYADMIVEPGSKYDSQIDDILGGSVTVDGGRTDGTYNTEFDLRSIYFDVRAGQTLTAKNGAYMIFNAANEVGSITLNGKLSLQASKVEVLNNIPMGGNAVIELDTKSLVSAKVVTGAGKIVVDATDLAEDEVQVINADMSGFTGTIEVEGANYEVTDGGLMIKTPSLSGAGTETAPYLINNVDDLIFFRNSVNAGETKYNADGVYVALGANIDLAGQDWSVNIGDDCAYTFDGIFDGKNFTIYNLTSTETAQKGDGYICTGLFGAIYGNAVVKNLTIENVTINTGDFTGNNVGAVVGFAWQAKGSIENVKVSGNININAAKATGVGAILGYDYYGPALKIENCSVIGNDGSAILGKSYVGGTVGYASSKIALNNNTVENVSITATGSTGAIAGIMLGGSSADGNIIKNVALTTTGEYWANSAAVVAGTISGSAVTVANTTVENVTANGAAAPIVGGQLVEKPEAPIAKVEAKIGNKYYTTLDAALAAEGNEVVELLTTYVIAAGETKTLDLKGKTVTMVYAENATANHAMILNKGDLTIESSVEGGKLSYTYTGANLGTSYAANTITTEPGSVLTVKSGTIENLTYDQATIAYAIDGLTNGGAGDVTVNIEGGVITSKRQAVRIFANSTTNTGTLNISGGELTGRVIVQNANTKANLAVLNITDGTFNANAYKTDVLYVGGSQNATIDIDATVSGGTFNGQITDTNVKGFITGGTYTTDVTAYCADNYICQDNGDDTYGVIADPNYIEELTLVDGEFTEFVNEKEVTVGTLTYVRSNIPTTWTPFYVPFEVDVEQLANQGFEVAYINGVRRGDTDFDGGLDKFVMEIIYIHGGDNCDGSGKTLKANYPYFIRSKDSAKQLEVSLENATLYAAANVTYDCTTFTETFEITGTSRRVTAADFGANRVNVYGVNKGEWLSFGETASLRPFRFYMKVSSRDENLPVQPISSMSISIRGEERPDGTTLIYEVETDSMPSVDYIFDLQGRRVLEPQKGNLYIINGKKVIF